MRVLVTGSRGFVGRHVVRALEAAGHEVVGLVRSPSQQGSTEHSADITDRQAVARVVAEVRPQGCVHLAGIAFVPLGWLEPQKVFEVNVIGALNLLEALRVHAPNCRAVMVSSALIYGAERPDEPRDENSPIQPNSLYAVSKAAADFNARLYARQYGMAVMTARPCNHTGPGQSEDFVVPSFARQLIDIAKGRHPPRMRVGNLDSEREFLDVRDVARAYRLILERGRPGEAYNVAGVPAVPVRAILEKLCALAGVRPELEIDPSRYRPTDRQPPVLAEKLRKETGWCPVYTLDDTLRDLYASLLE